MASPMPNGRSVRRRREARKTAGYTYVAMLVAVAVIGIGLSATGIVWSQASQREKERELIFAGAQLRDAIERYYERSPGVKRYPAALEDLLADRRFPGTERHLRRVYADPFSGKPDWALIEAPGGGIMGVHSKSTLSPVRNGALNNDRPFQGAKTYQEWRFFYDAQPSVSPHGISSPSAISTATSSSATASSSPGAAAPGGASTAANAGTQAPVVAPGSQRTARAR